MTPDFATQSAFAPGRVELLGNHTDYNGGVVLSAALSLGTTATGRLLPQGAKLSSAGFPSGFFLEDLAAAKASGDWTDYPLGVISVFREAGYDVPGVEIRFQSTIPFGAGLSSSASIEVATARLLTKLLKTTVPGMELARLCRRAENQFVGVNCGLLDQVSSVFGEENRAVFLDCESETVETVPFPEEALLLITDSRAPHRLTGGEYNARRSECHEAARFLQVPHLRASSTRAVLAAEGMPELPRKRALHITGENERVFGALESLRTGDCAAIGALMSESHRSSASNFENSSRELDVLVQIAGTIPGVFGCRLTGGGFGGATVSLVRKPVATAAAETLAAEYLKATGLAARTFLCQPGHGAR